MSMVGPATPGKSHLIFQMLKKGTFVPPFDENFYFYKYFQKLYAEIQKEVRNIEFIGSLDFDFIENLPNDGTNYLLIFDDSCDEISRSNNSRKYLLQEHIGNSIVSIQNIICFKKVQMEETLSCKIHTLCCSTRDVQQIDVLGKQL